MLYSLLSPGKQWHQLSPLGGGWLAVEDLGPGSLCLLPLHVGGAGRWSWGAPSVQHQGAQHRIGTAYLTLGRSAGGDSWGQLWRVTPLHLGMEARPRTRPAGRRQGLSGRMGAR